jgi:hypothetical protein
VNKLDSTNGQCHTFYIYITYKEGNDEVNVSPVLWHWKFRNGAKCTTNKLNETSVIDASTTPPTTGTREPNTSKEGACRNKTIENVFQLSG